MTKIISWNVNGIRAAHKKGFLDFLYSENPDILCVQETKALKEQLPDELINPDGYETYWFSAEKKGYSGTALFTKKTPLYISNSNIPEFDSEGRIICAEYDKFVIINCYFPNSQALGARLDYKINFNNAVLDICEKYRNEKYNVIITGDFNVAHKPIDLANPDSNETNPGYLPEERAWMTEFLDKGYVDTFRKFNQSPNQYTWWSYRFRAREKNIGWRIDYFCVNREFEKAVKESTILSSVKGSDHCPVLLTLNPM
jgi:exodeoxyribonuclease-3